MGNDLLSFHFLILSFFKAVKKPLSLIVWDKLPATRMGLIPFGVVKLAST